jgi:hypothetical protein
MSTIAILFGFAYDQLSKVRPPKELDPSLHPIGPIAGTRVDLFLAFRFCCEHHYDKIIAITDIQSDEDSPRQAGSILTGKVDVQVTTLIESLKRRGAYVPFAMLRFEAQLEKIAKEIASSTPKAVMIYYTGHAHPDEFLLPDSTSIPFSRFRDILMAYLPIAVPVFWILDCCHGPTVDLPYRYDETGQMRICPRGYMDARPMLCFSSGPGFALSTQAGSQFTRAIFRAIEVDRTIAGLLRLVREEITSNKEKGKEGEKGIGARAIDPIQPFACSTRPHESVVWSWVIGRKTHVTIDWSTSSITIGSW